MRELLPGGRQIHCSCGRHQSATRPTGSRVWKVDVRRLHWLLLTFSSPAEAFFPLLTMKVQLVVKVGADTTRTSSKAAQCRGFKLSGFSSAFIHANCWQE